jgi:hypothetical protein
MASLALSASLPACECRWLYGFSFLSYFQHSAFRYWQAGVCLLTLTTGNTQSHYKNAIPVFHHFATINEVPFLIDSF